MEGYNSYNGGTAFVDGHFVVKDLECTVDTTVKEFELDVAVVDNGTWSSFPRADFTWASLVALRLWDVRNVEVIGYARPQCADVVRSRYMERSRCRFEIPSDIRCDWTFLEHERDGVYVKEMSARLFEGGMTMPLLRIDAIWKVVVGDPDMHEWKTFLSIRIGSGRMISVGDY